jgi:hypothetical protein
VHTYTWDVAGSGVFGLLDNVVLRIQAIPAIVTGARNAVPGPYLYGSYASQTYPFRARGTQIRVVSGTISGPGVLGALVYRRQYEQLKGAEPFADVTGSPFRTDAQGYLQGRGQIYDGDHLVALLPITSTDTYTLYYTSAAPSDSGLNDFEFQKSNPGVQTLIVSSTNPLVLFNLDVSLEWDARQDQQFLSQLRYDLGRTSELLYDWSNGQAALGQVRVYQDRERWDQAQVRIYASNRLRPNAAQGGIVTAPVADPANAKIVYEPGQVRMGAVWNRYGEATGNLGEDWPRALAHEIGHYAFFLQDTYLGLNATGQVVSVDGCPGAMSDPYREDYGEFFNPASFPGVQWSAACATTLAARETGRWDWQTIGAFYPPLATSQPWLNGTVANPGPSVLPLAVTQITVMDPVTPTEALDVPIFSLTREETGERVLPGTSARAFLYQDDHLTDLGRPTLDQVVARGAREGDELCVYEPEATRLGCESVTPADRQLALYERRDWQPEIFVTPVTSRTLTIDVDDVPAGYALRARLYPTDSAASAVKPLAPNGARYTVVFDPADLAEPIVEGYVRVWVEGQPGRREAIADFTLGGNPAHKRLSSAHKRLSSAPVISADGQVILFGEGLHFDEGQFYTLQALARVTNAPAWTTVVGQGYRLTASAGAPDLRGTSLSISYLASEVAPGEEEWIRMYYSADGLSWRQLTTDLDTYYNAATALVQGPGLYALMSSIEIDLPYAGWNLFAYPVTGSQPVSQALQSISGFYSAVYGCNPTDTSDPWQLYCPAAPDWVNDLEVLEFGRGYWINVSEPVTIGLKGSAATLAAPATANGCGFVPPATYYGTLEPEGTFSPASGVPVTAWIAGHLCGQALTRLEGGQVVFSVDVPADDVTANPGCGAPGRSVTFKVGGQAMRPAVTWDNNRVTGIALRPGSLRLYLPYVMK